MNGDSLQAIAKDEAARASWLRAVPVHFRRRVGAVHAGKLALCERGDIAGRYAAADAADGWLKGIAEKMSQIRVPADISDAELCELADDCARKAMSFGEVAPGVHIFDLSALRGRLSVYVQSYGIEPPKAYKLAETEKGFTGIEDGPALARMTCPIWWRRALRKQQGRKIEAAAIKLGYVHKKAEIYASNVTIERRAQQRARNAAALESTDAINLDTGEIVQLAKLAEASVANPRIRRGELMTRIAGFELVARGLGHVAEFVTLTCPSTFHAMRRTETGGSEENPKYAGATPREAAKYLGKVWARIRAKLARIGLPIYGFRIAEPHGDGCPHWHLLLFMRQMLSEGRSAVARFRAIFRRHALRMDVHEPGARRYRCKFDAIDFARGSAAGYVAKYVAKNVDGGGYVVDRDLAGDARFEPAQRVEAWAATWGIRQFQQVGGPPVGVWRELRRLPAGGEYSDKVEQAREAADCGPMSRADGTEQKTAEFWARYVQVQGGPVVKRADLPVVLAKTREGERWNAEKGEPYPAPATRYGDKPSAAVYGVLDVLRGQAFCSMRGRWEIRRNGNGNNQVEGREAMHFSSQVVQSGIGQGKLCAVELDAVGVGFDLSRTRVNNCTRGGYVSNPRMPSLGFSIYRERGKDGERGTEYSRAGAQVEDEHECGALIRGGSFVAIGGVVADRRTGRGDCHDGA